MNTTAPQIGRPARAITTTATEQRVILSEVTKIESESEHGWYVWGYRRYNAGGRASRRSSNPWPGYYFIPKGE